MQPTDTSILKFYTTNCRYSGFLKISDFFLGHNYFYVRFSWWNQFIVLHYHIIISCSPEIIVNPFWVAITNSGTFRSDTDNESCEKYDKKLNISLKIFIIIIINANANQMTQIDGFYFTERTLADLGSIKQGFLFLGRFYNKMLASLFEKIPTWLPTNCL